MICEVQLDAVVSLMAVVVCVYVCVQSAHHRQRYERDAHLDRPLAIHCGKFSSLAVHLVRR